MLLMVILGWRQHNMFEETIKIDFTIKDDKGIVVFRDALIFSSISQLRNTSTAEPYIPALYFDLDLKGTDNTEINTVDDLFDKTVEIIKERKLPVSFLTKSG